VEKTVGLKLDLMLSTEFDLIYCKPLKVVQTLWLFAGSGDEMA